MGTNKQDRDVRLKKEIVQMMGERDESIRQAFEQFDQKVGQGFQGVEYKLSIVISALNLLGINEEKLQEIAKGIQAKMGGEQNEQNQGGPTPTESIEDPNESEEQPPSNEGGDEHFG